MAKFHDYSANNLLLISMQKPDVTRVAGFSAWKTKFGHRIKKREKGIKILALAPYKANRTVNKLDPDTLEPVIGKDGAPVTEEQEVKIPSYKVVTVFDVSQIEGKELPDITVASLTGNVDRYEDFFTALKRISPVSMDFEKTRPPLTAITTYKKSGSLLKRA